MTVIDLLYDRSGKEIKRIMIEALTYSKGAIPPWNSQINMPDKLFERAAEIFQGIVEVNGRMYRSVPCEFGSFDRYPIVRSKTLEISVSERTKETNDLVQKAGIRV